MHKNVFSNGEVADYQNKSFVNVEINSDRHNDFIDRWHIKAVPATIVFSPQGEFLAQMGDEYDPQAYIEKLKRSQGKADELRKLQKQIADSPQDPDLQIKLGKLYVAYGDSRRAAVSLQAAVDIYKKKEKLSDEERKTNADLLIQLSDLRIADGAKAEEIEGFAARLEELGLAANALFLRGVAAYARGDNDKLYDAMREVRSRYPEFDKDDAALVWIGYVLLTVRQDKKEAKRAYLELVNKHPRSKFVPQVEATLRRDLKNVSLDDK